LVGELTLKPETMLATHTPSPFPPGHCVVKSARVSLAGGVTEILCHADLRAVFPLLHIA
jgi:hypothetical protein